jgi:hypothetical protein
MHGVGRRLCQVQLADLTPHIARDEFDGGLHFGDNPLGFRETSHARLAELFLLGNRADRIDVLLDIARNQLAVAPDTSLQVDKVIGVANGADALAKQPRSL